MMDTLAPCPAVMAPRGALFQHLADLEQAASRERQLARQRLHQKSSGEILTTW